MISGFLFIQTKKLLNKKETREKQKEMKTGRRKFKLDEVYDIGVKAKQVWEEVIYRYITLYSQTDPIICPTKKEFLVDQQFCLLLVQFLDKIIIQVHESSFILRKLTVYSCFYIDK